MLKGVEKGPPLSELVKCQNWAKVGLSPDVTRQLTRSISIVMMSMGSKNKSIII